MTCWLGRLVAAAMLWTAAGPVASAETLAATVTKWGLLGAWAIDCSLRPDRGKGAVLTYEIREDGRVLYRRNFGDAKDENEVVGASIDDDGLLNIKVFFPSLHEAREYGLALDEDGDLHAIYNRNQRGDYTIKDGKFVKTGALAPAQHKCANSN
jgi:hypothetical protein